MRDALAELWGRTCWLHRRHTWLRAQVQSEQPDGTTRRSLGLRCLYCTRERAGIHSDGGPHVTRRLPGQWWKLKISRRPRARQEAA